LKPPWKNVNKQLISAFVDRKQLFVIIFHDGLKIIYDLLRFKGLKPPWKNVNKQLLCAFVDRKQLIVGLKIGCLLLFFHGGFKERIAYRTIENKKH